MTRDSTATPPADAPVEPASLAPEPEPEPSQSPSGQTGLLRAHPDGEIAPAGLDPEALKVLFRLRQHGHQAYLVGGCVRDLLLGHKPKDFDVATSAHPGEVRAIFRNCRLIGRRFRLAHVYFKGGKIIEVSTFRANPLEIEEAAAAEEAAEQLAAQAAEPLEGEAAEGEVPEEPDEARDDADLLITQDNVFGTAEQDARRRDFTINGLFYDVIDGQVIDYVRGRRDLNERFIRTIGDPEIRMREDPVRILRAVRFACKLDLDIESRTYAAMEGAVEDLPRCAPPRLLEETFKLIRGGVAAPSLKLLAALDALKVLLPPVDEFLKREGRDGEALFYRHVEALDRRVLAGPPLEDAILLAALLLPLARVSPPAGEGEEARELGSSPVEDLLLQLVRTARLPRRIAERCRVLLLAQRTLTGQRRRRGSLASFRRHPLFAEAMVVFEISVEATGEFQSELDAWKSGGAPQLTAAPEGQGPRRRRRRRRRGGRPGSPQGTTPASEG